MAYPDNAVVSGLSFFLTQFFFYILTNSTVTMHRQVFRRVMTPMMAAMTMTSLSLSNINSTTFTKSNNDSQSSSSVKKTSTQVYSWGSNAFGQLVLGNEVDVSAPRSIGLNQAPQTIACGGNSSAIVTENGSVYTFGAGIKWHA